MILTIQIVPLSSPLYRANNLLCAFVAPEISITTPLKGGTFVLWHCWKYRSPSGESKISTILFPLQWNNEVIILNLESFFFVIFLVFKLNWINRECEFTCISFLETQIRHGCPLFRWHYFEHDSKAKESSIILEWEYKKLNE